jgi:hypothetical protein
MSQLSPERRHLRARKMRAVQTGDDTTQLDEAIAAARAEEAVQRIVDQAPQLDIERRAHLARILLGGAG